jgi:predicted amidohydrolase YtcJ
MKRQIKRLTALMVGIAGLLATPAMAAPADVTIYEARTIITMEPSLPTAKFVAVADGIILGTSDTLAELDPWTHGRTVKVDRQFAKNTLMPGLIDPHVHPMQAAIMLNLPFIAPDDWDLPGGFYKGAQTPEAFRIRLREELAKSEASPFIVWGHHQLFHGPIDRAELDQIAPARAVVIWQRSFHEVIMNSAALKLFALDTQAQFDAALKAVGAVPAHGDFAKGVFSETALGAALIKLRPTILAPDKLRTGMAAMQKMMLTHGVTTVADMATGIFADFDAEAGLIKASFERPDNPSRVMLIPIGARMPADENGWLAAATAKYASPHIRIDKRMKLFADGAFFAQNMQMNAPGYSDGHEGKWLTEPNLLKAQMTRFWNDGFSLHIHVNGDKGLDTVLDGAEHLAPRPGQTLTLEHLGYSTEAQNRRIARAGLFVSAQPNYIRVLGDAYSEHGLGPDRGAAMNRLGSLERKNVPLGLHSDFNMAPIEPLYLAWVATNRVTIAGHLKAPAERISLDKAMRAITIEAAQVIGMDAMIGSIAAGKKADFAVMDRNPYEIGAAHLREVSVKGVVFEGRYFPAR